MFATQLHPEQQAAVDQLKALVASGKSGHLVGGLGTGRTTTIKALTEALSADGAAVQVVAPTGLGIRKLIGMGVPAQGVHDLASMPSAAFDVIIVDCASLLDTLPPEDQTRITAELTRVARTTIKVIDSSELAMPPISQSPVLGDLPVVALLTRRYRQR